MKMMKWILLLLIAFSPSHLGYAQGEKLTVTGKLIRAAAVGGESTGWVIELPSDMTVEGNPIHSIQVSFHDTGKLEKFANKNVTASGTVSRQQGTETGQQLVLEISSLKQGPASLGADGQPEQKKGLFQKLKDNAEYQQQQQQNQAAASSATAAGKPDNSDQSKQAERAKYLETHACLTTDGPDKANELAADCNKVTDAPHKGCNIQENTCDEIRKATQKGCWGLGASAPDFCLTKYR